MQSRSVRGTSPLLALEICIMIAAVFLSCLLGSVLAQHAPITCNNIEPLTTFDIDALKGDWVAVESVAFSSGQPFNPPNVSEDSRTKTCIFDKTSDVTATGMTAKMTINFPGRDPIVDTNKLTQFGDFKGRYSISSDKHDRDNWQFLVIDTDPSKYLVYVLCQPPNAAGDRFPERVNLMARVNPGTNTHVLSNEELTTVEHSMSQKLKLTGRGIVPVKYDNMCWKNY